MKRFCTYLFGILAVLGLSVWLFPDSPTLAAVQGKSLGLVGFGGLVINAGSLQALFKGYRIIFQEAFTGSESQWQKIATLVPSTGKEQGYPWLGQLSSMREWIGDRVIQALTLHDYTIKNKPFELTVGVLREDIEDDTVGVYNPLFAEMGRSANAHPDELVFSQMAAGFTTLCYDGQYFFDTDHPVNGASVSNYGGGAGTAWYLLDISRAIKPIIFQQRKKPEFVALDNPNDQNVFMKKEFLYGIDCRDNVGFALWQLAYASKQTLDATAYAAARAAMGGLKNDAGRPLNIKPNLLVVPPSLEGAARKILQNDRNDAGAANEWVGTAEVMVASWLA
jgi:phage major head subunit gpT-like protein